MAKVVLASQLARWLPDSADGSSVAMEVAGGTVGDVLEGLFQRHPNLRGYVIDERGMLRRHVAVFLDGAAIHHHSDLREPLAAQAEVYVMQALSGG